MFGGTLVLIYQAFKSWKNNRTLSVLVLLGALVPWVGNVMAVFDSLNPVPEIWIDALLLGVSLVAFGFALLRLRLLEFLPFAYQTVFNNVPDGIVVLDLHHRILAINAEVLNFYKNQLGNYLGKPVFEVFPDQAEFLREVVEKDDYQVRLSLENRNLSLRVALMHNIRRERIGRLLIITDTTLETMMEQSRKDAEVFSQTMIDVTNNLNSTLDTNKVLLSLLESMQRIVAHDASTIMIYNSATKACHVALTFGYTPEVDADLRTRTYPLKDFWTLRTTAEQRTPLIVTDTSTAEQWTQLESVHKIASFACAPIFVDDELVGFINLDCWQVGKLKNDISPRLQLIANQAAAAFRNARLYEQTRTQADELARNLEALTVANQLNQARAEELETLYAQVQGLEQLKSDMIRVAAHDLKNPLNVIMSYTNMLNEMPEFVPEDINKVYTTMFDSANRMDQIIRDFLSLERIGKIAQELTVSPFDMNEVVKRAQVEFESQLVKKHITLQTDLSNTPCVAIGDEVLTYEALANFVSNAVKYTQEGGNIAIQVTKENDQIKVSVKDDGIGIPEESHDRLFHAWLMFRLSEDEQGKQSKWAKLPCG
jgi:K+-sensing histidine kinase KdpD